jgi:hypothetical protein
MARILSREQFIASDAIGAFSDLARRRVAAPGSDKRDRAKFFHTSAFVRRDSIESILNASSLRRTEQRSGTSSTDRRTSLTLDILSFS